MAHWQEGGIREFDVTFPMPFTIRRRVEALYDLRRVGEPRITRKALYVEIMEAGLPKLEKAAQRAAEGAQKGAGAGS